MESSSTTEIRIYLSHHLIFVQEGGLVWNLLITNTMKNKAYQKDYAKYADLFDASKNYKSECDFLDEVFKKHSKIAVKSVLDLGCGTGNHSRYLSEKGFSVVGLDLSGDMIGKAKLKDLPDSKFEVGDMRNFDLGERFDSVICMFAALGYANKDSDLKSTIDCVKKHLNTGGIFVFDCWNGLGVMHEPPSAKTREVEEDSLKIIRTSYPRLDYSKNLCEVKFDIEVRRGEEEISRFKERHLVRFFFPQEVKKYLERAGFKVLEICPTFEMGKGVDHTNWWMVVISRLK